MIKCIISNDNEITAMKIATLEKCNNDNWLFLPTNLPDRRASLINKIINKEYKLKRQVTLVGDFTNEEIDKIKRR